MITIKDYVRAKSLEEAWQLNQNRMNRIHSIPPKIRFILF